MNAALAQSDVAGQPPGVRVDRLSFSYGGRPILKDVSITVSTPGEVVALIGPNGSGKSTLMRCMAGLLTTAPGMVLIGGRPAARMSQAECVRRVCFMPQFFAGQAALTVFETVLLARKNLSGWRVGNGDVEAVSAILTTLGIGDIAEAPIGELSGGQQQMVSLAQSLIRQADCYLFDEPTSALDLRRQLEVMTRLKAEMRARSASALIALHDLTIAARFADRILLMREGRIVADGDPRQVLLREEVAETYGVKLEILHNASGELHVSASL